MDFTDNYRNINDWESFNEIKSTRASRSNTCEFMPLCDSPLTINKEKYYELQSLNAIIERDHHPFYDNFPYLNAQKKRNTVNKFGIFIVL